MQYLAWRVRSGLNKRVEISFLLVGHTKFAPDWSFGLLKQKILLVLPISQPQPTLLNW